MVGLSWLKYLGLGSKKKVTKTERKLVRDIRQLAPRQILQIGLGDGSQACELIGAAQEGHPGETIVFTGMDLFEGAQHADNLMSLRDAYRLFRGTGAEVRLIPGSVAQSLPAYANHLQGVDVAVIAGSDPELDEILWKFLPRMLAPAATVFYCGGVVEESAEQEGAWRRFGVSQLPQPRTQRPGTRRQAA